MANIKLNDLKPADAQLFSDSESFLNELSHDELDAINGGASSAPPPPNQEIID